MSHCIEQDHTGLFGLCVFGAENTSDDEVTKVFEQFGQIARFNRTTHLIFISYSTLEEAVECYENIQNISKFYVKPAKRKDQRSRDGFGDQNRGEEMNSKRNVGGISMRPSNNVQSTRRAMPPLKFDTPLTEVVDTTSQAQVYQRVIVAHLHPHMKQGDVYNLCKTAKAPPCHIDMKSFCRPPYPTEYYAIVHVMGDDDVKNIVRGLNNLKINGYQLVVAPYEKLVEDGKSSL